MLNGRVGIALLWVVCLVVVTAGFAVASSLHFSTDFTSHRRHLRQVSIDPEACGAVRAIHEQLNELETAYVAAELGINRAEMQAILHPSKDTMKSQEPASSRPTPFPVVRAELDVAAAQLDATVGYSLPAFPPRIQHYLVMLRADIADGRATLADARRPSDLDAVTGSAFDRGQRHAGFAGDLVGRQCPVSLGANNF